jgi:predicted dehydrogenase
MLDTTLHLLGDFNVSSISGQTYAKFGPRGLGEMSWGKSEINPLKPFDVDDFSVALIKLKAGRTIVFEASWAGYHAPENREYGLDLLGTEAGLSLYPARLFRNGPHGYESIYLSLPKVPHTKTACIISRCARRRNRLFLRGVFASQRVLDAIYASSTTGKRSSSTDGNFSWTILPPAASFSKGMPSIEPFLALAFW